MGKHILLLGLLTAAFGCAGSNNARMTQQELAYYGGGDATVANSQNALVEQPRTKYQSVMKPVSQIVAEPNDTLFVPAYEGDAIDTDDGTLSDPTLCPGQFSSNVPQYSGYDGNVNDDDYGAPLDAPLPNTALTSDDSSYDYDSDDEPSFSKPSNGFGSSKSDPSPMGGNSTRFRNLR